MDGLHKAFHVNFKGAFLASVANISILDMFYRCCLNLRVIEIKRLTIEIKGRECWKAISLTEINWESFKYTIRDAVCRHILAPWLNVASLTLSGGILGCLRA